MKVHKNSMLFLLAAVAHLCLFTVGIVHAAEICGDGLDNDSDLLADEGCSPYETTGACEQPLGCEEAGAVAPVSGALVYELVPDLSVATPYGPKLEFKRTYRSMAAPGGTPPAYRVPLGAHWAHNYMSWLDKDTSPSPDQVVIHLTTGREVLFQYDTTTSGYDYYTPQEGFHVDYLRQSTSTPYGWEMRTLTGEVYAYDTTGSVGKLTEIRDSLSTPNVVTIAYDGNGQVYTVTDASSHKRLLFEYSSGLLSAVRYQTVDGATVVTRVSATYSYDSGELAALALGGVTTQTLEYGGGQLESILDGDGNAILNVAYLANGKVARSTAPSGETGFEYASNRSECSGGTVIYSNRTGTVACDDDSDCGSDFLCGGETDPSSANTGVCYRAARCLQTSSPTEDLIDTVAALPVAGLGTGCTGACVENTEYSWSSTHELAGSKDANGVWTSYQRNANGLVAIAARGDTDDEPTNDASGFRTWLFYADSDFPGRATEVRTLSELKTYTGYCDGTTTTDCARTLYTWNSDGLLGAREEIGFTLNAAGATISYDYTTTFTYDSYGRLTSVDGPLSGSNDVTSYTYWSSSDVLADGYLKELKRKKDATSYLTTTYSDYGIWGKADAEMGPDGTYNCMSRDANHGKLTERRVAMAGQSSCATVDTSDIRTKFVYDSWGRLTKTEHPLGNCTFHVYDGRGRIVATKERDDCTLSSAGDTIEYTYSDDSQVAKIEFKNAAGSVVRRQEWAYFDGRQVSGLENPVSTSYSTAYTYSATGERTSVSFENYLGKTEVLRDVLDRDDEFRRYTGTSTYDAWLLSYPFQRTSANEVEDDDGKTSVRMWDDSGRQVKSTNPDGGTTVYVYDAGGRVTSRVEAFGAAGQVTHDFTYDNLGRVLTEDYGTEYCGAGEPVDVAYTYDAPPVSCPTGGLCSNTEGRLAHVRTTLLCSSLYPDHTLDQETFYAYDDAGHTVQEFIRDDSGRTAVQAYEWDKNGHNTKVTFPSGTYVAWTMGSSGSNSDAEKIYGMRRYAGTTTWLATATKWMPFGPLDEYEQYNVTGGPTYYYHMKADLEWNLGYRPSSVLYKNTSGTSHFRIDYSEDAKGRTAVRDYSYAAAGVQDEYLQYDLLDRLLCDAAVSGACPTSGSNLKTNVNGSPPYTASGDRMQLLHRGAAYGTYTYAFSLASGKDQISYMTSSPSTGTTYFAWDDRGNRTADDSTAYSYDARHYYYDGRANVRQMTGYRYSWPWWYSYTITNAYDQKGRRVFKSYVSGGSEAQWFFYYDLDDRLVEVRYTPNISSPSTYTIFQFYWMGERPVAYWQIDYPSVTTTRRYYVADDDNRVLEVWSWPTSGASARVWAANPDRGGWDEVVAGATLFQPLRGANGREYEEVETTAWNGTTPLRPPLRIGRAGAGYSFDPLTGLALVAGDDGSDGADPSWTGAYVPRERVRRPRSRLGSPVLGGGLAASEEDTLLAGLDLGIGTGSADRAGWSDPLMLRLSGEIVQPPSGADVFGLHPSFDPGDATECERHANEGFTGRTGCRLAALECKLDVLLGTNAPIEQCYTPLERYCQEMVLWWFTEQLKDCDEWDFNHNGY
ncbi:MAG: RHS repeat protein [Kofleriaceae bacterium]|nr:RHS repeat protein [Kofleriaceae bacterium]MCB9572506.1 RHS repeat protein [Kofleriaceae bacterium]